VVAGNGDGILVVSLFRRRPAATASASASVTVASWTLTSISATLTLAATSTPTPDVPPNAPLARRRHGSLKDLSDETSAIHYGIRLTPREGRGGNEKEEGKGGEKAEVGFSLVVEASGVAINRSDKRCLSCLVVPTRGSRYICALNNTTSHTLLNPDNGERGRRGENYTVERKQTRKDGFSWLQTFPASFAANCAGLRPTRDDPDRGRKSEITPRPSPQCKAISDTWSEGPPTYTQLKPSTV